MKASRWILCNIAMLAVLTLCWGTATSTVHAAETVTVTFTTTTPAAGAGFDPKNVFVLWAQDSGGAFVKTIGRWANNQKANLTQWYSASGGADVDGVAGATQSSYSTYSQTWDLTNKSLAVVPDGTYTLRLELTNSNSSANHYNRTSFTFVKNGTASVQTFASQGGYLNVTINYSGRPVTTPKIALSPTALAFASTTVGSTSNLSVNVQNTGTGALQVTALTLGGTDAAAFSLVTPPALPFSVAAGGQQAITVKFSPTQARAYGPASLTIANNDTTQPNAALALTGTGTTAPAPKIVLNPVALTFASTNVGASSNLSANIQNTGTATLQVTALTLGGTDAAAFTLVSPPALPFSLAAGGQQAITVKFSPTQARAYGPASLTIANNDATAPSIALPLNGAAVSTKPSINVTPATLTFGAQAVGSQTNQTLSVTNSGPAPLHITSLKITGLDAAAYQFVTPPALPITLAATTGQQTLTVRFSPADLQSYAHANATIGCDDTSHTVVTIPLSGSAAGAALKTVQPTAAVGGATRAVTVLADGSVCAGQGAVLTLLSTAVPTTLTARGQVILPDSVLDLASSGSIVYAALGASGVAAVSVANPAAPGTPTILSTPGYATGLSVSGNLLAVAAAGGGVVFYNIATPAAPVLAGSYLGTGPAKAVALVGTTAYILDEQDGLLVVNAANPLTPVLQATLHGLEFGQALAISGTRGYVADYLGFLRVVNLTAPTAPVLGGSLYLADIGHSLAVNGTTVYVALGTSGLQVVNCANLATPVSVSTKTVPGATNDLAIATAASRLYIASAGGGVRGWSLTVPTVPVETVVYTLESQAVQARTLPSGDVLAAGGEAGLQTIDLTAPAPPALVALTQTLGEARGVAIVGSRAFVANGFAGLTVVDLSNPRSPVVEGEATTARSALDVAAMSANLVLVCDGGAVYSFDTSTPAAPVLKNFWPSIGYAYALALSGKYAYVANGGFGLQVLSVGTDGTLTAVGSLPLPGVAQGIAIDGTTAYVAAGAGGLQIVDLTNPVSPTPLASLPTAHPVYGVAVAGSLAYLAAGTHDLTVVDVSTPASPVLYARSTLPAEAWSVTASGGTILLAQRDGGLLAIQAVLAIPTGLAASDGTFTDHIHITWNAAGNATNYRLSRSNTSTGTPSPLGAWQTALTYDDTTAAPGTIYYYYVQSASSATGIQASPLSAPDSGFVGLAAPGGVTASNGTSSVYVTVNWNAVTGAAFYRVSRSDSATGSKTPLGAWQAARTFNDTTATPGTTYYYWVQAGLDSGGTGASAYGGGVTGYRSGGTALPAPTGVAATLGTRTDSVRVTWTAVTGAADYLVSRSDTQTGAKTDLGTWQSATTFDDTTATPGTTYYYWVRAAANASGTRASTYGGGVAGSRAVPGLNAPTSVAATQGTRTASVRVTWKSVTGAGAYLVSRATSLTGAKTDLGAWQTGTTYDDTTATPGATYYYWVRAAVDTTGAHASAYGGGVSGWRALANPTGLKATDGTSTSEVTVTWTTVNGAVAYSVSRAATQSGTRTVLSSWQSGTTFSDTTGTPGVTYYYWVQAATDTTGNRASTSGSTTGWRALSAPTGVKATSVSGRAHITWSATPGALYYEVARTTSPTATPAALSGWISAATSYDDTTVATGTTYYYFVRAATGSTGGRSSAYSAPSAGFTLGRRDGGETESD